MAAPSEAEIVARLLDANRASAIFHEQYETLRHIYPDQHVAMLAGNVIATGRDSWELMDQIHAGGFDESAVWTFFVPAEPMQILL